MTAALTTAAPRRRKLAWSVRAMMAVVFVVAISLGRMLHHARVQREAIAIIKRAGGTIVFDYEMYKDHQLTYTDSPEPPGPRWLRSLIGDELFRDVALVDFDPANIPTPPGDEVLAAMAHFPKLESIQLADASITDEGLRHIRGLSRLKFLFIRAAPIGDRGLEYLSGLTNLEQLYLDETSISDAGLQSLKPLHRLKELGLSRTNVGDDGMSVVASLDKLEQLNLCMTKVDEPGLIKLGSLTNLQQLCTSAAYEKTARLRSRLPKLRLWGIEH